MKTLNDDDYQLVEGGAWFDVKGFAIRIHATDEGVVADIFDAKLLADGHSADAALMSSTYAFDAELESNQTEED